MIEAGRDRAACRRRVATQLRDAVGVPIEPADGAVVRRLALAVLLRRLELRRRLLGQIPDVDLPVLIRRRELAARTEKRDRRGPRSLRT